MECKNYRGTEKKFCLQFFERVLIIVYTVYTNTLLEKFYPDRLLALL